MSDTPIEAYWWSRWTILLHRPEIIDDEHGCAHDNYRGIIPWWSWRWHLSRIYKTDVEHVPARRVVHEYMEHDPHMYPAPTDTCRNHYGGCSKTCERWQR